MAKPTYLAVGLMSGTSLDGIDAALLETDGEQYIKPVGFLYHPYDKSFVARMEMHIKQFIDTRMADSELTRELTERHARAVDALLKRHQVTKEEVDLIGFHGHTVFHAPAERLTCQMGDGAYLAEMTGCDVVYDFRTADVAAGGQGAPLAPLYHDALAASALQQDDYPVAFLNIGGVANVTYIQSSSDALGLASGGTLSNAPDARLVAYDTGPGNALMDALMTQHTDYSYDKGGEVAATGVADISLVSQWMQHSFFNSNTLKSLDKLGFHHTLNDVRKKNIADALATQLLFLVESIVRAMEKLPAHPKHIYVSGGGRHNDYLMNELTYHLRSEVSSIDSIEIAGKCVSGDATEAEAFAYLAVRSQRGLAISLPSTTGIPQSVRTGGVFCPAGSCRGE